MAGLSLIVEVLVCLFRVLWHIIAASVKLFLPVKQKDVTKEIVLVTGAGSGIGRLMALRFSELGAKVVLWDVNKTSIDTLTQEILQQGRQAYAYQCDLSKREEVYRIAAAVKRDVGDVTILINNAGVVSGKKIDEVSDASVSLTMDVNSMAHFWTLKAFLPTMMIKNHGYIITIASSAGLFGVPGLVDYCASKFAAVGIHEAMAGEIAVRNYTGIYSTLVCPYFINTGMFDGIKTRFLPKAAMLEAGELFGITKCMSSFVGRQKKE